MTQQKRYIVSWVPTAEVEKLCAKRGMAAGDGTSFWDWIEPEHCQRDREFRTFRLADKFAQSVIPADCFGEVIIERQELVADHDDLGNVFRSESWETSATWHVQPDDQVTEDEPSYGRAA